MVLVVVKGLTALYFALIITHNPVLEAAQPSQLMKLYIPWHM